MKLPLLEKLKCLECNKGAFWVSNADLLDDTEICDGSLTCKVCSAIYKIRAGILDMTVQNNPVIEAEVKGNKIKSQERAASYNDAWLLSLPEGLGNEHNDEQYDHYNFNQIINSFDINKDDTVLDLGCGTTWTSNALAKKSNNVIASDISVEKFIGLESARVFINKYRNYYERVRADMCKIPFMDNCIDITINEASLHHAHNLDLAMREISRVLKKDGKAVFINEPMANLFDYRKPSKRHGFFERETYGWNENKYNILEHYRALKRAGLKIEEIFYPESVRHKLFALAKNSNSKHGYKYRLGKILAGPYSKSPFVMRITEEIFFYPMLVFGIPFCAIAVKY